MRSQFSARLRKLEAALAGRSSHLSYEHAVSSYREFEQRSKQFVGLLARRLPSGWSLVTDRLVGTESGELGSLLRATSDGDQARRWFVTTDGPGLRGVGGVMNPPGADELARFAVAQRPVLCIERAWLSDGALAASEVFIAEALRRDPGRRDLYLACAFGAACWWEDADAWFWRFTADRAAGRREPWINNNSRGPRAAHEFKQGEL